MEKKETRIYEASDYAGMNVGDLSLYYGYEKIFCPTHHVYGMQESTSCEHDNNAENDCDNDIEWCFAAKFGDKPAVWYSRSDLEKLVNNEDSTSEYLLAGIAKLFEDKILTLK